MKSHAANPSALRCPCCFRQRRRDYQALYESSEICVTMARCTVAHTVKWDLGPMVRRAMAGLVVVVARSSRRGKMAPWPPQSRPETRNLARHFAAGFAFLVLAGANWWPFVVSRPPTTSLIDTGCRSARRPRPRSGFPTPCLLCALLCARPRWWLLLIVATHPDPVLHARLPRGFRSACCVGTSLNDYLKAVIGAALLRQVHA